METSREATVSLPQEAADQCSPQRTIRIDACGRSVPFAIVATKEAFTGAAMASRLEVVCDAHTSVLTSLTTLCITRNWPFRSSECGEGTVCLLIEKTPCQ